VLIVDNDAAFLHTMAEVLQLRGFETLVARDLAEAKELIRSRRPAAIMLHMHLGTTTPADAVAEVHGAGPHAPLILYSGQPDAERAIDGDVPSEWVHSYFQKPIPVDRIAGVLSAVVES
jgi:DNA-binding NtrC family response regulator